MPGLALPSLITLYEKELDLSSVFTVGISQSGKAADALAVIERSNACGGISAAITNDISSPMAKTAKYHLYCKAGKEESVAATKTFTAQMGIIVLLAAYLTNDEKLLESFRSLPELMIRLNKKCDDCIKEITLPYRYMENGFVLSRGLTYPIALEAMLKIQETCYVKMRGYSASDFYHGPIAQVDRDTPVIIFAPKGKAFIDNIEIAKRISLIGAQPFIVTNESSLAESNERAFLIPESGNEITDVFIFALFVHRFAESLCASKGLNPDAPRNLNKVTITR